MSDYESRLHYRGKGGIVDYKLILSCKLSANRKVVPGYRTSHAVIPLHYSFDDLAPVKTRFDRLIPMHLRKMHSHMMLLAAAADQLFVWEG
jgi:hypothetical protein